MKTVALWFLIAQHYGVSYSPPMATLSECERILNIVNYGAGSNRYRCVQINVVKEPT